MKQLIVVVKPELTIIEGMRIKDEYCESKEGKYCYKKWRQAQDELGVGSPQALAMRDYIEKEIESHEQAYLQRKKEALTLK